jgi:hypothetical protein
VSGWWFLGQLTAILLGLLLGSRLLEKAGKRAAASGPWRHFLRAALVVLASLGFFGLSLLADRVDSRMRHWITYVGMVACVVYGALHHYGRLRGKSL